MLQGDLGLLKTHLILCSMDLLFIQIRLRRLVTSGIMMFGRRRRKLKISPYLYLVSMRWNFRGLLSILSIVRNNSNLKYGKLWISLFAHRNSKCIVCIMEEDCTRLSQQILFKTNNAFDISNAVQIRDTPLKLTSCNVFPINRRTLSKLCHCI